MSVAIVQLPATSAYYSQVKMHTSTTNPDISLARGFQKHISNPTWAHGLLYHGKEENVTVNGNGLSVSIMPKTENMCHKHLLTCHLQQLSSQYCHFAVRTQNLMK